MPLYSALEESLSRLRQQGLLDEPSALRREIQLVEDLLDTDLLRLNQHADALRLKYWRQEGGS